MSQPYFSFVLPGLTQQNLVSCPHTNPGVCLLVSLPMLVAISSPLAAGAARIGLLSLPGADHHLV